MHPFEPFGGHPGAPGVGAAPGGSRDGKSVWMKCGRGEGHGACDVRRVGGSRTWPVLVGLLLALIICMQAAFKL